MTSPSEQHTLPAIDTHTVSALRELIAAKNPQFTALSDSIWDVPELNYEETRSAALHEAVLKQEGFRLTTGIAGMPTALLGECGSGKPVIALLGEYDALPGLSQQAGVAEPCPIDAGGNGHGCGHNLLGTAALQAATAVKDYLQQHQLSGTVRFYGCPAEEGRLLQRFYGQRGRI